MSMVPLTATSCSGLAGNASTMFHVGSASRGRSVSAGAAPKFSRSSKGARAFAVSCEPCCVGSESCRTLAMSYSVLLVKTWLTPGLGNELHGTDGVAAETEEAVVQTDIALGEPEDAAPEGPQAALLGGRGRDAFRGSFAGRVGLLNEIALLAGDLNGPIRVELGQTVRLVELAGLLLARRRPRRLLKSRKRQLRLADNHELANDSQRREASRVRRVNDPYGLGLRVLPKDTLHALGAQTRHLGLVLLRQVRNIAKRRIGKLGELLGHLRELGESPFHQRLLDRLGVERGHDQESLGVGGADEHEGVGVKLESLLGGLGIAGGNQAVRRVLVELLLVEIIGARVEDETGPQLAGLEGVGAETTDVLETGVLVGNLLDGLILDVLEVVADGSLAVDLEAEGHRRDHRALNLLGAPDGSIASRKGLAKDDGRKLRAVGTLELIAPVRLGGGAVNAAKVFDEVLKLGGPLDSDAIEGLVDLVDDEGHAPAVVEGVVHCQHELHLARLLFGDEGIPDEGSSQIHALLSVLHKVALEVVANMPGDVLLDHDLSKTSAGDLDDSGAEDGAVCGGDIEGVAQLVCCRGVGEVNDSLRDERKGGNGGLVLLGYLGRVLGHVLERREVEDARHRQGDALLSGSSDELHGTKGIAAEGEEAVVQADAGLAAQDLSPHLLQRLLHLRLGLVLLGGGHAQAGDLFTRHGASELAQALAVDLARDQGRHLAERDVGGGDHVAGDLGTQRDVDLGDGLAELGREDCDVVFRVGVDDGVLLDDEGDEGGLAAAGLDDLGHDLDARGHLSPEVMLDFGQLDSLAAELDLLVLAAHEGDGPCAVGVVADQIPRLVEAAVSAAGGATTGEEPGGILDEDLVGFGLVVEVPETDDGPLDEKLADGSDGHETLVVIGIDDPGETTAALADVSRGAADVAVDGAADGALGWAVGNDDARRLAPRRGVARRDGLAAQAEDFQGRDDIRVQDTGDGGGHVRHVALGIADGAAQVVHAVLVRRNAKAAARGEGAEHAVNGNVEGVRCEVEAAGVRAVADGPATGDGAAGEVFVRDHNSLGLTRAAGRELDVKGGGWRDVGQLRGELEGILVEGLVGGDDEDSLGGDAPAELALPLGGHDDGGAGLLDDGAQTGLGLAGVGEREGGASLHDGQERHGRPPRLLEAHGHRGADLDSPVHEMAREAG
ncbi:hypothetical protein ColKHC_10910 [Colletotrichum higginsianum]|nr:hypothetical protein ColKHC_10910 [Colletotrichum higginsianum]